MTDIVIVGSGYAGLAGALELASKVPDDVNIHVISEYDNFLYVPSLIWVAQGERELEDISFPITPVLEDDGIKFTKARVDKIDAAGKSLTLSTGETVSYDKLLLTVGSTWNWDAVPGSAPLPEGNTVSFLSPFLALAARADFQQYMEDPGPIVIGLTLNASLYGAAYEFALDLDTALRKIGKRDQLTISFVTPEPYLGHFGHDGIGRSRHLIEEAFQDRGIVAITEAQITDVEPNAVFLSRSRRLEAKLTMIIPPYKGTELVKQVPNLANEAGLIPIDEHYRSPAYSDIFAAGTAVQVEPKKHTNLLPLGVFTPSTVSSEMGRIAATNLAADLGYGNHEVKRPADINAVYVLDSGDKGLFLSLGPQSWLNVQLNLPGPFGHWAKVMTEKFQMWQIQSGNV